MTDHTATTRGYTRVTRVPIKTGQCHPKSYCSRTYSRSSFCKPLQNAAICFNLLQSALQENAIFCNGMLRNVSFCFAHTCSPPPQGMPLGYVSRQSTSNIMTSVRQH